MLGTTGRESDWVSRAAVLLSTDPYKGYSFLFEMRMELLAGCQPSSFWELGNWVSSICVHVYAFGC